MFEARCLELRRAWGVEGGGVRGLKIISPFNECDTILITCFACDETKNVGGSSLCGTSPSPVSAFICRFIKLLFLLIVSYSANPRKTFAFARFSPPHAFPPAPAAFLLHSHINEIKSKSFGFSIMNANETSSDFMWTNMPSVFCCVR